MANIITGHVTVIRILQLTVSTLSQQSLGIGMGQEELADLLRLCVSFGVGKKTSMLPFICNALVVVTWASDSPLRILYCSGVPAFGPCSVKNNFVFGKAQTLRQIIVVYLLGLIACLHRMLPISGKKFASSTWEGEFA